MPPRKQLPKLDFSQIELDRAAKTKHGSVNATKQFIAWDGEETRDCGYCLFGNSKGFMLRKPNLSTDEMLALIIDTGRAHPSAFHVGFAFYYDVNWILKDIGKLRIAILHKRGRVSYNGYSIQHIPHKIFTVSKMDAESSRTIRVRIDDCFTFFRQRFDKALIKYGIGTKEEQEEVTEGKDNRKDFWWSQIDYIEEYWRKELRLLVDLMDKLRKDINGAGIYIGQWHGPGALASHALRQHEMGKYKRTTPKEILPAVLSAYSAGWFERFSIGYHDGPVWTADINSAYVHAISLLPNLAHGEWEHIDGPIPDRTVRNTRFALYRVEMDGGFREYLATSKGIPMPLPVRNRSGTISHPVRASGWYWSPEASLVLGNNKARITEAWIFHDDGSYPFEWVRKDYEHRLLLQRIGNPAEKVLKWMLASLYGRLAQRVGWNEKTKEPPAWHQLEWAGFITSMCRYMCFIAAIDVAKSGGLVSIDTDGVMSTVPFKPGSLLNGEGDGLGQWKVEEFSGLIYIQNGIYWLRGMDGEWTDPKLRGVDKDGLKRANITLSADEALKVLANGSNIVLTKQSFIGYGQALQSDWSKWRTWESRPHEITLNGGKRKHSSLLCRACQNGYGLTDCLHDMTPIPADTVESQPHTLPWMQERHYNYREMIEKYGVEDAY